MEMYHNRGTCRFEKGAACRYSREGLRKLWALGCILFCLSFEDAIRVQLRDLDV